MRKHLCGDASIRNAVFVFSIREQLLQTAWVTPDSLVAGESGAAASYACRFFGGEPAHWWETRLGDDFPPAEIVGRAAVAIQDGVAARPTPRIEHAGNVMIDISGACADVAIVDIDACCELLLPIEADDYSA